VKIGRTVLRFGVANQAPALSARVELGELSGKSTAMRRLYAVLEKLGPSETTALILGETGVGKETIARTLHGLSARAKGAFVVFDCASVNPNLIESQLFGHMRGAFTGAHQDQPGAVQAARGGTLFLDEIGELPLGLQPKLLRVLEAREYQPLGAAAPLAADCRLIAATHVDLEAEVKAGRFREDLYFRLAVAVVQAPPLRARAEDIPLLATRFAREISGVEVTLAPSTLAALQCHAWPGNVRELKNAVRRVLTLGELGAGMPEAPPMPSSYKEARDRVLEEFERDYLRALLERNKGNVSAAARESKVSRRQFYRLLERHGLVEREA
jgi:DNA-binding NtrC family response regulator